MDMSIEDYNREYDLCLSKIIQYKLKKDTTFLEPLLKLKSYLDHKPCHEKDRELIDLYLKNNPSRSREIK